uniref:Uncharacterized protein n=1 Tax=Triticum urartu TaxID=4572 RepID=A0A8R7P709_TRIUA
MEDPLNYSSFPWQSFLMSTRSGNTHTRRASSAHLSMGFFICISTSNDTGDRYPHKDRTGHWITIDRAISSWFSVSRLSVCSYRLASASQKSSE